MPILTQANANSIPTKVQSVAAGDNSVLLAGTPTAPTVAVNVLTGAGDPTTSTVGVLGQTYINTTTNSSFECTDITLGVYTWFFSAGPAQLFPWITISSGPSFTLSSNFGYFVTATPAVDLFLPATSNVGDIIKIANTAVPGSIFYIKQAAGQNIIYGNVQTTGGVAGNLSSDRAGDALEMVCSIANLQWFVLSNFGNFSFV